MILIPVKGFTTAKQRLAPLLTPEERTTLARAMLEDVLRAFASCVSIPAAALVTSDATAARLGRRFGFDIVDDDRASSETQAVAAATRACLERGVASILVIPADVPLIETREIEIVLGALPNTPQLRGTVLVPAHDGRGTNAALLRPPDLFELRFGDDSFEPHLVSARKSTQLCKVLHLPGIALDVDNPADVAQLLQAEIRTEGQKLLHSWRVPDRLKTLAHGEQGRARSVTS